MLSTIYGRYAETAKQECRCDHVADPTHFKLRPISMVLPSVKLRQNLATEFGKNRRHGFRREVRPESVSLAEQPHQRLCLSVHVKDPHRRRKQHHTRDRKSRNTKWRGWLERGVVHAQGQGGG